MDKPVFDHYRKQTKPLTGLSLGANFSWTFAGNVFYTGTQWGFLILLTKLFEPEIFGRYALALSVVTPIFAGSALQLRAVQITDVEERTFFSDYLALRLITNLSSLLLIIILYILDIIASHYFLMIILLGLNQAVMLTQDIYQGFSQKRERMDVVAISQILHGFASLTAATIVALLTRSILLVIIGMISVRLCMLIIYDIPKVHRIYVRTGFLQLKSLFWRKFSVKRLILLARFAFPLGIVQLLLSLYLNIPRYFLASSGEAVVGFFAATASLVALQELIIGALGQSAVPRMAQYFNVDMKAFYRLVGYLCLIALCIGFAGLLIAVIFGSTLLALLFRKEYAQYTDVFVWLMVGKIVINLSSAVSYAITSARIFRPQVWIQSISIVSLFASAWFLVPSYAGLGAAWAMLVSAVLMLIASIVVLMRGTRLAVNSKSLD